MENFNTAIYSYSTSLWRFAFRFTNNSNDADDLLQDTFMKALSFSKYFKEGSNLQAWLFTIMKNTYINNYKSLKRKKIVVETQEVLLSSQLLVSASSNKALSFFVNSDIKKALHNLDSQYSLPFTLYYKGFKYYEIAEELTIPIGTVKTRIHIARQLLKKSLKIYNTTSIDK